MRTSKDYKALGRCWHLLDIYSVPGANLLYLDFKNTFLSLWWAVKYGHFSLMFPILIEADVFVGL